MSLRCVIKNKYSEWVEEFEVNTKEEVQAIIDRFNATLRPGEEPRELVKIVEEKKLTDLTDDELLEKYLKLKSKGASKAHRGSLDEVAYDTGKYLYNAIHKNRLQQMYNAINDYVNTVWDKTFREVILEMRRRGWKGLNKRLTNYYKRNVED